MSKLVELKSSDGTSFFIESSDVKKSGVQQASGHMDKQFDKILEKIRPFSEAIIRNFQRLDTKPDTASAEFGLSVTAEGSIFVVKASGEASVKITLNWNNLKTN
jgi:Trypsin-co-occurring domain 1